MEHVRVNRERSKEQMAEISKYFRLELLIIDYWLFGRAGLFGVLRYQKSKSFFPGPFTMCIPMYLLSYVVNIQFNIMILLKRYNDTEIFNV